MGHWLEAFLTSLEAVNPQQRSQGIDRRRHVHCILQCLAIRGAQSCGTLEDDSVQLPELEPITSAIEGDKQDISAAEKA
jgi:hypothetical protein